MMHQVDIPDEILKIWQDMQNVVSEALQYAVGLLTPIRLAVVGSVTGGVCHVMFEDRPGVGKTRLAEVLVRCMRGKYEYLAGHPDLMASDIIGGSIFDRAINPETGLQTGSWKLYFGKIADANWVVFDEGNRAGSGPQNALLVAMSEGKIQLVKHSGITGEDVRFLHKVFQVFYTQNPLEDVGTNPLPRASHDRFLFSTSLGYPTRGTMVKLLKEPTIGDQESLTKIKPQVTLEKILKLRSWIEKNVIVTDHFVDYFANMVLSTEPFTEEWMQLWDTKKRFRPVLKVMKAGISPRAAMALMKACKVRAFLFGTAEDGKSPRTCVMAEDLKELFPFAAKHRLYLTRAAQLRDNGGLELSEDDDVLPFREPNIQLDRPWTAEEVLELVNRKGPAPITPTVASLAVSSAWDHTDRLGGEPVRQSSLLARLAR